MHTHWHRLSAFLAGCLILGSAFMILAATQNFGTVDRILASPAPEAGRSFETLGPENARALLRYVAGEQNQLLFTIWELAQIILAAVLTAILLLSIGSRLTAGLSGAMLIVVLFQHFRVTPEMVALGKLIEFNGAGSAAESQFYRLHGLYGALEVAKLAILIAVAAMLLFTRRRIASDMDPETAESSLVER